MSVLPREFEGDAKQAGKAGMRTLLQVALTLAALGWYVHLGAWRETVDTLAHLRLGWFGGAVALYLVGQSLCAWKWGVLARGQGFQRPWRFYWSVYLGAMFPALFLPTSIGGDVFRVLALAHDDVDRDRMGAAVSVLADRGTGVLAMAFICLGVTLGGGVVGLPAPAVRAIWLAGGLLAALFALPFIVRPLHLQDRWSPLIVAHPRLAPLGASVAKVLRCWDDPPRLLTAAAAALVFQGIMGAIYLMLGLALGLSAPPLFYFVLAPVASLAAALPFTINGLGERMAALILLFDAVGVGREQAVAFGFEWTALATVAALVGAAVFVVCRRPLPAPVPRRTAQRSAL